MSVNCPCYKCPDRWVEGTENCHMYCDAYKQYNDKRQFFLEERTKQRIEETFVYDVRRVKNRAKRRGTKNK